MAAVIQDQRKPVATVEMPIGAYQDLLERARLASLPMRLVPDFMPDESFTPKIYDLAAVGHPGTEHGQHGLRSGNAGEQKSV